ncbi:MAG: DUF2520 domain-containing protein [Actinobacteria bacterium]|nr:DUF2520 domain-containing protein [Actinomycetota bacterium]
MEKFQDKHIGIIGAGRVGLTLAFLIVHMKEPAISLKAICSPALESRKRAKELLGEKSSGVDFYDNNSDSLKKCNTLFICTPDDSIERVCKELVKDNGKNIKGKLFIHFSGAKTLGVLDQARNTGGITASLHPIKSFASVMDSIKTIPGTVWGVTYPEDFPQQEEEFLSFFIKKLKGRTIRVEDSKKSLYHAAACVSSNYLVSLINYAVGIHEKIGISAADSLDGLMGLIEGTVDNIKKLGTKKSLTGPIARGDTGTVEEHILNFKKYLSQSDLCFYKVMGLETSRLAFENGWIDRKTHRRFLELFSG